MHPFIISVRTPAILLVIIFLSINYKVLKMVFSIAPPVFTPKISAQQIFITGATVAVSGIFAFLFMVGIL